MGRTHCNQAVCPRFFSTRAHSGAAASALQAPSLPCPRRRVRPDLSPPTSLESRYADIYSFGRQQLASHSTAAHTNTPETNPSARNRRVRAIRLSGTGKDPGKGWTLTRQKKRSQRPRNKSRWQRLMFPGTKPKHVRAQRPLPLVIRRIRMFPGTKPKHVGAQRPLPLVIRRIRGRRKKILEGRYRARQRQAYTFNSRTGVIVDLTLEHGPFGRSVVIDFFAALDRRFYRIKERKADLVEIRHKSQIEEWALALCEGVDTHGSEHMLKCWIDCTEAERDKAWYLLLLYLVDKRPDRALQFIHVLAQEPYVTTLNSTLLADALEHIARLCESKQEANHVPSPSEFVGVFELVFRTHLADHPKILTQHLLLSVARLATIDELRRVLDSLFKAEVYMSYSTLLHYANIFGEFKDHGFGIRCLQKIVDTRKNAVERQEFRWSCAVVLRRSMSDGQNYHSTTEIVADILKLGVKLDILLYNVIMHNAMEAGDYPTAFRVFNLLQDHGLQPDNYTFSILLHGCTTSDKPEMFHDFAEHCAVKARELKSAWLATDYLYYLYVRHHQDGPEQLSARLVAVYSHFFSPEAMRTLLPIANAYNQHADPFDASAVQPEVKPLHLEPPEVAVYIMLQTQIQKAASAGGAHVRNFYLFFKNIIMKRDYPVVRLLAKNPIIWNAFLLAFCRNQQFEYASQLITDMTEGFANAPQPNVYSWNIFMQAFFKNDQVRAAERVSEIMHSRGVKPDQYTYGVMLRGYARAQHIEKIGVTMSHIEDQEQLDPMLLKNLTLVHNRKKLMVALEKARAAKQRRESGITS